MGNTFVLLSWWRHLMDEKVSTLVQLIIWWEASMVVVKMMMILVRMMMRKMQQGAQFLLEGLRRECRQRPRWDVSEKNRGASWKVQKPGLGWDLEETSHLIPSKCNEGQWRWNFGRSVAMIRECPPLPSFYICWWARPTLLDINLIANGQTMSEVYIGEIWSETQSYCRPMRTWFKSWRWGLLRGDDHDRRGSGVFVACQNWI